jgi:hypothetical protein
MSHRQKIDTSKPARTLRGNEVAFRPEMASDGKPFGSIVGGPGRIFLEWDEWGRVVTDHPDRYSASEYDIVNVPEDPEREPIDWLRDEPVRDLVAEQRQIEADAIAEFRDGVKHYVEKRLGRTYDPSFHGVFEVGREVGFVQLNHKYGEWEVWDLCDGFCPIDTLPPFIPADELGYFWNWLREREKTAEQAGAERGFQDGMASFQRRLRDLLGPNPNKFYRKD